MTTNYDNGIYSKAMYDFIARCSYDHYVEVLHRNGLNAEYGNDSYQGIFLKLYIPANETRFRPAITIESSSDNLINQYELEVANDCYNRQLLYGASKPSKRGIVGEIHYDYAASDCKQGTYRKDLHLDDCIESKFSDIPDTGQVMGKRVDESPIENEKLSNYYTSKHAYNSRKFNRNIGQLEIRSMALSDAIIKILDPVTETNCDTDQNINKAYSNSISDLSKSFKRLKRPQTENRLNETYDDDGEAIDPLLLIGKNVTGSLFAGNSFDKKARKLLKNDKDLMVLFDGLLSGKRENDMAIDLDCHVRTVRRLKTKLLKVLSPIASDLQDYLALQRETSPCSWTSGNSVFKEHSESHGHVKIIDSETEANEREQYIISVHAIALHLGALRLIDSNNSKSFTFNHASGKYE